MNVFNLKSFDHEKKDQEYDIITVQLMNLTIRVKYSQLYKYSKLIQDEYSFNEASQYLKNNLIKFEEKYLIKEASIKSFFIMIEDEDFEINFYNYSDFIKLSRIFKVSQVEKVLESYLQIHSQEISFIIDILIQHKKNMDEFHLESDNNDNYSIQIERILTNKINECLQIESFGLLPISTIYRIIKNSDESNINSELLYDFIIQSIEKRCTLFNFVNIKKLSENKFMDIYNKYKESIETSSINYYSFLGFDVKYLEFIKELMDISKLNAFFEKGNRICPKWDLPVTVMVNIDLVSSSEKKSETF